LKKFKDHSNLIKKDVLIKENADLSLEELIEQLRKKPITKESIRESLYLATSVKYTEKNT